MSRSTLGLGGLVVLFASLPFLPSVAGGFVWDDWARIANNPHLTLGSLPAYWVGDPAVIEGVSRGSMYNPLVWSTYVFEVALAGGARVPLVFHLTNLLIHGLVALGMFLLIRGLAPDLRPRAAAVVAVVASWAPLFGETAGWISARPDALAVAFIAIGAGIGVRARSWRLGLVSGALLGGSLLAKESGAFLAGGLVLFLLVRRRDLPVITCATAAAAVTAVVVGVRFVRGVGVEGGVGALRLDALLPSVLRLVRLSALPIESASALRPLPMDVSPLDALVVAGLIGLLFVAWRSRSPAAWPRLAGVGVLWLLLGALPNAVAATRYELLPDRYAAVAAPGLGLLLAACYEAFPAEHRRRALAVLVIAGVLLMAPRSSSQTARFADDVTFFDWEVARWPDEPQGWFFMGCVLAKRGRYAEAEDALARSTELSPTLPQAWLQLALTRDAAGDRDGARGALAEGLRRVPGDPGLEALQTAWGAR